MKRFLYILCCLIAIGLTLFLVYRTWLEWDMRTWYQNLVFLVAILGWCLICDKIINRKYKWTQKFFD